MKNQKNWGIFALAVLMFLATTLAIQILGNVVSMFGAAWIMIGWHAYKGDIKSINLVAKWSIIAGIVVAIVIYFFIGNDGSPISVKVKNESIMGIAVMLIPKFVLYLFSKAKIESFNNGGSKLMGEVRTTDSTTTGYPKKTINDPLEQKNNKLSTNNIQSANKKEILKYQINPMVEGNEMEIEHEIWERVLNEYEGAERKKGLWTKLFVELDGDEKKIKIQYIKNRVEQLMQKENSLLTNTLEILPEDNFYKEVESAKSKFSHESKNTEEYIASGVFLVKQFMDNEYYLYPNGQAAIKWIDELRVYNDEYYVKNALKVYTRSGVLPIEGFARKIPMQSS